MNRPLRYLLIWLGSRKIGVRYRRGRKLEKLVVKKIGGDMALVDSAIDNMLASHDKPLVFRHIHYGEKSVYCLHLPVSIAGDK